MELKVLEGDFTMSAEVPYGGYTVEEPTMQ